MNTFDYATLGRCILSTGIQQGLFDYFTEEGYEGFSEKILQLEESLSGGKINGLEQLMKSVIYKYLELNSEQESIEEYFQPIIDLKYKERIK